MIDPDVEIVDLDPDGFALLNRLLAPRIYAAQDEIHVLHASGHVEKVVSTTRGVLDDHHEAFSDARTRARELLEATGADRVILIDRDRIDDLSAALLRASDAATQPELLWRSRAALWSSAAVAVAPEPHDDPWPDLARRLREAGDEWWAVLAAWRGDEVALSVVVRFVEGRAVLVTSSRSRPPRDDAQAVLDEVPGQVAIAWLCDLSDLEAVIAASDPRAELSMRARDALYARGLELLTR